MDPVTDNVDDHAQLEHERPSWIEETKNDQKTHRGTTIGQHVQKCPKARPCTVRLQEKKHPLQNVFI